MTKECLFCGGKCGRVCRGLGFPRAVAQSRPATSQEDRGGRTVGSIPATGAKVNDRDNRSGTRKAPKSPGRPASNKLAVGVIGPSPEPVAPAGTLKGSELANPPLSAPAHKGIADKTGARRLRADERTSDAPKTGRPRVEDRDKTIESQKPWLAAGMSRATWYSRRKAKRESK